MGACGFVNEEVGQVPIDEATFVITDVETTGTSRSSRVIEVGAVKVRGGEIIDRFSQLIDPECLVPRRITEITGITSAMVFGQPKAADVLPDYAAFLEGGVFVAHNATFDVRLLAGEFDRLGSAFPEAPVLCTLRLARRLLKGLRSKGLAHVADFYNIPIHGRHRALGDAEATAHVLLRFLSQLQFEFELETVDDLLRFQHSRYQRSRGEPKHLKRIRDEVLPEVPARPGVYFMLDRSGAIIYIGKAKRLDRRVKSYFSGIEAKPARTRKMLNAVRDVRWTETGSELAALLQESALIKQHQPRFNRALRRYRNRPFIRLDVEAEAPTVRWVSYIQNDGASYYGPLSGRRQAELVVDVIQRFFPLRECDDDQYALGRRCLYADLGRCLAPCEAEGADPTYDAVVDQVRAFLTGEDASVLEALEAAMREAAQAKAYEEAARYRDWRASLERMIGKRRCIAAPVFDHHAVLLQPVDERDAVQVFVVRYGRHIGTHTVALPLAPAAAADLRAFLADRLADEEDVPDRYWKKEVDEVRILAHWMYVHREALNQLLWEPGEPMDTFIERVVATLGASLMRQSR